ncbi:hypothetical protein KFE25_011211 [Diacronema lutheri]|uniref:MD-2-related lipid-recognition domain-containing protein n=1 Tax=Diacronema lutheri TaxID=2081491 RepID=A0A8J5XER4_DIALT|nr:hypothetical protein KFE25_011211 [Diacronema lutheri]
MGAPPSTLLAAAALLALVGGRALPVEPPASRRLLGEVMGPHHFERCPGVTDHLRISAMDFDPDPVKPDAELRVAIAGTLDREVDGGAAKLTVSYYGVPLAIVAFDICKQFGIVCPKKAGTPFNGRISYHVPTIPLSGVTLDVQIDVTDAKGAQISCIKTQAKVAS